MYKSEDYVILQWLRIFAEEANLSGTSRANFRNHLVNASSLCDRFIRIPNKGGLMVLTVHVAEDE